jgi:CheY-like chemotaxis protein
MIDRDLPFTCPTKVNHRIDTEPICFDYPISNSQIAISMRSSLQYIPMTRNLTISNYPDDTETQIEKIESLLPITPSRDWEEYEHSHGSQALAGMRILVVDDEPDCATLTGYLLTQWGADVKIAVSAPEALEIFEQYEEWPPDILVSDIQMPGVDGYMLMRRVREMAPDRGGNIPAIALTAYTRAEDRIRALVAGFQIHIAKPFEPIELLTVVESIMNR